MKTTNRQLTIPVKARLTGNTDQLRQAISLLSNFVQVSEVSRFYPNSADNDSRCYLLIRSYQGDKNDI
jgi:hypothetical protein